MSISKEITIFDNEILKNAAELGGMLNKKHAVTIISRNGSSHSAVVFCFRFFKKEGDGFQFERISQTVSYGQFISKSQDEMKDLISDIAARINADDSLKNK